MERKTGARRRNVAVNVLERLMRRWAIFCLLTVLAAGVASSPAAAQQAAATYVFPGVGARYNDPLGAPRNVCFSAAALHRWCRVFVTSSAGPCVCGGAANSGVFAGTLITDAQLYEFLGEDVKQAEVGANGRRLANSHNYNGF